eukprot:CAMPEP_0197187252 /NCGR_PEP_ID=MMETSP1423-20130617/15541_1 /TAXON_ID=476441 /ORGANISM="Pseudo-nitzschia heimii, Strain UNC1101" /LENGTH=440 /DNA_ID=CAMNT_0042638787 /DNA_START=55 /DNA_END=1377 /DNA_ORIENTATION=-
MSVAAASRKERQLPVGREHVECDAPGCSNLGPSKRCSRCHGAYYCNTACQRAHWKSGHRTECFEVDSMRNKVVNIGKTEAGGDVSCDSNGGDEDTVPRPPSNTSCFICLSEPMVDPFTLPRCGHAFCFACLQTWQAFARRTGAATRVQIGDERTAKTMTRTTTCPACREEAPDIVKTVQETALLCAARAVNRDLGADEQTRHRELALRELDKLVVDPNAAIDPSQKCQALFTRAEILQHLDKHAEALEALEEAVSLQREGQKDLREAERLFEAGRQAFLEGRVDDAAAIKEEMDGREKGFAIENYGVDFYLSIAKCKTALGDYKGALDVYKFKVMAINDNANCTPPQQRMMVMGMSECFYHIGQYENAIELGEMAIEMNRFFPQVHKYVALSQKASGDREAALRTMGRAVNHETPWDEANRKIVIKMYEDMKQGHSASAE